MWAGSFLGIKGCLASVSPLPLNWYICFRPTVAQYKRKFHDWQSFQIYLKQMCAESRHNHRLEFSSKSDIYINIFFFYKWGYSHILNVMLCYCSIYICVCFSLERLISSCHLQQAWRGCCRKSCSPAEEKNLGEVGSMSKPCASYF